MAVMLNGFVLVSTAAFLVFLLGLYGHLTDFEENGCNMTYLFEYPQFIRVTLDKDVSLKHRRYGLYAFAEGSHIEKARAMKFDGIPVLFVPGSRGSHKQVRSLASVSLRKWLGSRTPFHFDYFGIDLDNDNSGLFGGILNDQTDFLKISIKKVLSLYKGNFRPQSVVLVGHSMGGLVAKGVFLEPDFNADQVKLIITLATPHLPTVLTDHQMAVYYDKVAQFWSANKALTKNLTLISIGGGARDIIVKSSQTVSKFADINIISPSISDVWLSVDHYCILWCKELVLVLVRALFDCVDLATKQITNDVQLRKDIFRYHLIDRSAGKKYQTSTHPNELTLWNNNGSKGSAGDGTWTTLVKNQFVWKRVSTATYITIPLATAADTLVVEAVNHKTKDWLFSCKADGTINGTRICKNGKNLSEKGRIYPSNEFKRKLAILDLSKLRMDGNTHVVVRTFPTNEPVRLSFDMFRKRDRSLVGNTYYLKSSTLLTKPTQPNGALYYSVDMVAMHRVWNSFQLVVESDDCFVPNLAHVTLNIPWSNEGTTKIISGQRGVVPLTIFTAKPNGKDIKDPKVEIILNPECSYTIRLEKTFYRSLSSLVGNSAVGILSSAAVCLLMTLSAQITSLKKNSNCPLLHLIIPSAARPYYILPAFSITSALARYLHSVFPILPSCDIPQNNGLMDALFIPLLMHCSGLALTYFLGLGLLLLVVFQGQAFNGVILRFLNKFVCGVTWISEYIAGGLNKVPIIVSVFMVTITFTACSGLAMCIGLVFYFFKLVSLYEDFWQEIVYWPLRALKAFLFRKKRSPNGGGNSGENKKKGRLPPAEEESFWPKFEIPPIDEISFHLTMIMLWALPTFVSVPSVLFWGKNYRYSVKLENDPFFVNGIILSVCGGLLWQGNLPRSNLPFSKQMSQLVFVSSILVLLYGQLSVYRLSWIVVAVIAAVTAHQIFAQLLVKAEDDEKIVNGKDGDSNLLVRQIQKVLLATDGGELDDKNISPNDSEGDKSYSCSEDVSELSSPGTSGHASDNDPDEEGVESSPERSTNFLDKKNLQRTEEEKTPSDDASSSFENISVKDVRE